jgi:hypothetical protein
LPRLLSTPSGIDRTLGLIYYLSLLLAPQLSRLALTTAIKLPTRPHPLSLTKTSSRLSTTSARLRLLASRISDVRIFLRLWGLIGIYQWGVSAYSTPADPMARALELAQVAVNTGFQVTENIAYLSRLKLVTVSARTETKLWLWSARCWAAHIALDFVRLERLRRVKKGGSKEEKRAWRKQTLCNAANAPLAVSFAGRKKGRVANWWGSCIGARRRGCYTVRPWVRWGVLPRSGVFGILGARCEGEEDVERCGWEVALG